MFWFCQFYISYIILLVDSGGWVPLLDTTNEGPVTCHTTTQTEGPEKGSSVLPQGPSIGQWLPLKQYSHE